MKRLPFAGDPISRAAPIVLILLILIGIGGQFGLGGDPTEFVGDRLQSPSRDWPLGTDALGRSVSTRVISAIGITVLLSSIAVVAASLFAVALGIAAAYYGGWVDQLLMRLADVLFAFPVILLAIVVATIIGPGPMAAIWSIFAASIPLMLRVVRGAALDVVGHDYVKAARVGGVASWRVIATHIAPNVAGPAIVQATYALSIGMLIESGLSFLGLGVQAPSASLGSLLQEQRLYLSVRPWSVIGPGAVLALAILSVNLLGDGLRDRLSPEQSVTLS